MDNAFKNYEWFEIEISSLVFLECQLSQYNMEFFVSNQHPLNNLKTVSKNPG